MNKTNIYVSVRTPEECKAFLNIANKAKEPIYEDAEFDFINGVVDENQPFIHFDGEEWIRDQWHSLLDMGKTLITLDQLESMLCGNGEEKTLTKEQIYEKHYQEYLSNQMEMGYTSKGAVYKSMQEYADQQTSSLRKELEEKEPPFDMVKEEMKWDLARLRKLCVTLSAFRNLDKETEDNYSCDCGYVCPIEEVEGGGQIADTGDYGDCYCPVCNKVVD